MSTTNTVECILYCRTDEEVIALAESIIGNRRLRLTFAEAVAIIREHYTRHQN